jgi:hypothetical protein
MSDGNEVASTTVMRPHNFAIYGRRRPAKTQVCTAVSRRSLIRKRSEVQVLAGPLHLRRSAGIYLVSDRRFRVRLGARAATGSKSALPDVLSKRWESRSLGKAWLGRTLAPTQPAHEVGLAADVDGHLVDSAVGEPVGPITLWETLKEVRSFRRHDQGCPSSMAA